ncbi:unnamed protein product [Withania somnifera]
MVPAYVHDNAVEVRTAGAGRPPCFILSSGSSRHVRSALASDIVGLAAILGKDATIEHLFPIFHSFLKGNSSDVRLEIISKVVQMNEVIGTDLLSQSLLSVIVELTDVRHSWRIRNAMIEFIPVLVRQLGAGIYNDELAALCSNAEIFGQEWAPENIVPQVLNMVDDKYSLYRMNMLHALKNLAPVMGSEITCSKILPVILAASKDSIPNVRFNVAKVLKSVASVVDQSVVEKSIRPCLNELKEDNHRDVVHFAMDALQTIDQVKLDFSLLIVKHNSE